MNSSKFGAERYALTTDDDIQLPVNRNAFKDVDEVMFPFHDKLDATCTSEDELNRNFAKIIENKNQLKPWQIQWLNESPATGLKLMMRACSSGNVEAVEVLINSGMDLNKQDVNNSTASDYAWTSKNLKCLIKLLEADAPFPKEFDIKTLESSVNKSEIIDFARKIVSFHKSIQGGELDQVKLFVTENPKIKFAYNDQNQCALTVALECEQVDIYNFLCSSFYQNGIDSEFYDALEAVPEKKKEKIRNQLLKHLEKPIEMALLSKTRDRSGKKENFARIVEFYEALSQIPEFVPILQLIAKNDSTSIIFDFNDAGVFCLDPTADPNAFGVIYQIMGCILIGAKRSNRKVLATIAQEFTHLALQLVFNNQCQPFFSTKDGKRKEKYEEIVMKYENLAKHVNSSHHVNLDPEIVEVFDYPSDQWNKELIARVPQLLAFNKDSPPELEACKMQLKNLFDFFQKNVLRVVKREVQLFDIKKEIKELNKKFGVLETALKMNMLSPNYRKMFKKLASLFIESQQPELALESLVKRIQKINARNFDVSYIYVTFDQILEHENLKLLKKAAELELRLNFIIYDSCKNSDSRKIDKRMLESAFIIISKNFTSENFPGMKINIDFKWEDLNTEAKAKILESKILFQDCEASLREIFSDESLLQEMPLEKLLNPSSIILTSLDKTLPEGPRTFIERRFASISGEVVELFHLFTRKKSVLISDSPGMGKSVSSAKFARDWKILKPLHWIVFIDLKQHTKIFLQDSVLASKKDDDSWESPEEVNLTFFTEKLLKLETYEQKLFKKFYDDGKIMFIIDGFDEICPKYKNFVLKVLKTIKNSENHLLVTTRSHFTKELESELETDVTKLLPFDKKDQAKFLTDHLKSCSNNTLLKLQIGSVLENLLELFDGRWSAVYNLSTPLHIFMLAEIFADMEAQSSEKEAKKILELFRNSFSFYEKFFDIKFKIWNKEKGPLAEDDNSRLHQTFPATNLHQIFYRLAIEEIFSPKKAEKLRIPSVPDDFIEETIARVGIVTFDSNNTAHFVHRTYAEYFLASLIANQAFKKKPDYEYVRLFFDVIFDERYAHIWKLLSGKLESIEVFDTQEFSRNFDEIAKEEQNAQKLEKLVLLSQDDIYPFSQLCTFILETLEFDYEIKIKILLWYWRNEAYQFKYFETFWRCAKKIQEKAHMKDFLKKLFFTDVREMNILYFSLSVEKIFKPLSKFRDQERVSQLAIEISVDLLDEEEFLRFYNGNENVEFVLGLIGFTLELDDSFPKIWEAARKKLKNQDYWKDFVLRRYATGKSIKINDIFMEWLKSIKNLLDPEEFNERLNRGRSITLRIVSNNCLEIEEFVKFWEFIEKNCTAETQEILLFYKNEEKDIFLVEESIRNQNKSVTDFIFDISEAMIHTFSPPSLIDLLRERNFLPDLILSMIIHSNKYFDKYSSKVDDEEFQSILLKTTQHHATVFHCLVETKNSSSMWKRVAKEIFDHEEIKRLLFVDNASHENVFCLAAKNNNYFLIELLEWCKTILKHECIEEIFNAQNENGTLLHFVTKFGDDLLVVSCLEFVSNNFEVADQKRMLKIKNGEGHLPIKKSRENKNSKVYQKVMEFYENLFEKEELVKCILK